MTALNILTWNTLTHLDAFSPGWGCPLEMQRLEELDEILFPDQKNTTRQKEDLLSHERYERLQTALEWEMTHGMNADLILLQEISRDDPWTSYGKWKNISLVDDYGYDWIDCPSSSNSSSEMQQVLMKKQQLQRPWNETDDDDSSSSSFLWKHLQSVALKSPLLNGACALELTFQEEAPSFVWVVNLHAPAGVIREPASRIPAMMELWDELEFISSIRSSSSIANTTTTTWILCGDWNMHLSSIVEDDNNGLLFQHRAMAGMLEQNATGMQFSTSHEAGFLAQYDGCIVVDITPQQTTNTATTTSANATTNSPSSTATATTTSSFWNITNVSRNVTGFMPKGEHGILPPTFSYRHVSSNSSSGGGGGVYYNNKNNNDTVLIPGSQPYEGLSDHLRITTTLEDFCY